MKKIASKKTPIHFDTTFNIGEFYVSFFCFPDTNLYGIEFLSPNITLLHLTFSLLLLCTGNPAKFGPVFVHQKRDEHCYSTLFSQILCMDREFRNEVFFHILHVWAPSNFLLISSRLLSLTAILPSRILFKLFFLEVPFLPSPFFLNPSLVNSYHCISCSASSAYSWMPSPFLGGYRVQC